MPHLACKVKKLNPDAVLPTRADPGASGWDLYATETVMIPPGVTVMVSTGLAMEVPAGYEIQIRPRSGLAAKSGITVLNSPGTVDSSYRGEVKVLLHNTRNTLLSSTFNEFMVFKGDRIAQAVIMQLPSVEIVEVTELSDTQRGTGGFGSTGK
jgi:dUTP pyrophosphatase